MTLVCIQADELVDGTGMLLPFFPLEVVTSIQDYFPINEEMVYAYEHVCGFKSILSQYWITYSIK